MDNSTTILQILNEQSFLLRQISNRLTSLESELKKKNIHLSETENKLQSNQASGSSALAHLNSLGITW